MKKVPSLSLSDYRGSDSFKKQQFIEDFFKSFQEFGFVVIKDHGVPKELLKRVYMNLETFFSLPVNVKSKYDMDNGGQRGYTKFGVENAKGYEKLKDLKEFYHAGRDQFMVNVWPSEVPDFEPSMRELMGFLDHVGDDLLSAIGVSLGCGPDFLPERVKDGASVLRMLHYPPIPGGIAPGQERAKQHTDINTITILSAAQGAGLELLTKEGTWLPVESNSDELVVNMGDMLSRMCNYNVPSTIHRVVNPPTDKNESRYSLPYFVHFKGEVKLDLLPRYQGEELKAPVVTAHEYLMERLKEIGLKK